MLSPDHFEVISYKLMELLFPWILVGKCPLYLVSKESNKQWKKFLAYMSGEEFPNYHLRKILDPRFDDRVLFPADFAKRLWTEAESATDGSCSEEETERVVRLRREIDLIMLMFSKMNDQVLYPKKKAYLFTIRQLQTWTITMIYTHCFLTPLQLSEPLYLALTSLFFPEIAKLFLHQQDPTLTNVEKLMKAFVCYLGFGVVILPCCAVLNRQSMVANRPVSVEEQFLRAFVEHGLRPNFQADCSLDADLAEYLKKEEHRASRISIQPLVKNWMQEFAPLTFAEVKDDLAQQEEPTAGDPTASTTISFLSRTGEECFVSETHPAVKNSVFILNSSRLPVHFGRHCSVFLSDWQNEILEFAIRQESEPLRTIVPPLNRPFHEIVQQPYYEDFANRRGASVQETTFFMKTGLMLGIPGMTTLFSAKSAHRMLTTTIPEILQSMRPSSS